MTKCAPCLMLIEINILIGTFEPYGGSSPLCVQGESCREAAGALISSIADACDVTQRRAQGCSLDSLQPQQKPFGATSDRWRDPLCELACVLPSRCTQSDEEPPNVSNVPSVLSPAHSTSEVIQQPIETALASRESVPKGNGTS